MLIDYDDAEQQFMDYAKANGSHNFKTYPYHIRQVIFKALGYKSGNGHVIDLDRFKVARLIFAQYLLVGISSKQSYKDIFKFAKLDVECYANAVKNMDAAKSQEAMNAKSET